jgi:hypothetical protein
LSNIHQKYIYHAVSGVNEEQLLKGRPYGGTAILWRKEMASFIKPVVIGDSKRLSAVTIDCQDLQLLLINCYMPVDSHHKSHVSNDFLDTFDAIECAINKYPSYTTIFGGDLNLDTTRLNAHDVYFNDFLQRQNMSDVWDLPVSKCDYTYRDHQSQSCIDRFVIPLNLSPSVLHGEVIHNALNPSNHQPITMDLALRVAQLEIKKHEKKDNIAWHKVHDDNYYIHMYHQLVDNQLLQLPQRSVHGCNNIKCTDLDHNNEIDLWCDDLINCCLSSDHVFPRTKNCKGVKPGWTKHVKPYREENLFWFNVWCEVGKPSEGVIYNNMRESKRQYFYAVRRIKRHEQSMRLECMSSSISNNKSRDFFKEIKKMYPKSGDVPCINSFTKHEEIAQCFGNKYKSIYNSVTESQRNMAPIYKHIQENLDCVNQEQLYVQFDTVVTAVKSLNKDKSDGDYGYFSNHLLYAGNNYLRQLTMLINAMLVHGHQPTALLMATIASVPKDSRGNMCSDANYRGIALSSSIGKVLDRLFIYKNLQNLCTSDLQFAYKKKLSTTTCTLVMKEIIKYYMDNQSNVYSCIMTNCFSF